MPAASVAITASSAPSRMWRRRASLSRRAASRRRSAISIWVVDAQVQLALGEGLDQEIAGPGLHGLQAVGRPRSGRSRPGWGPRASAETPGARGSARSRPRPAARGRPGSGRAGCARRLARASRPSFATSTIQFLASSISRIPRMRASSSTTRSRARRVRGPSALVRARRRLCHAPPPGAVPPSFPSYVLTFARSRCRLADAVHEPFMRRALALAQARPGAAGEVPIGALVVRAGEVVGEGSNRPISAARPHRARGGRRPARGRAAAGELPPAGRHRLRDPGAVPDVRGRAGERPGGRRRLRGRGAEMGRHRVRPRLVVRSPPTTVSPWSAASWRTECRAAGGGLLPGARAAAG